MVMEGDEEFDAFKGFNERRRSLPSGGWPTSPGSRRSSFTLGGADACKPANISMRRRSSMLSRVGSVSDFAATAPAKPAATQSSQRWWHREVAGDKSLSAGLYEVHSGLVRVHAAPDARSAELAVLRGGTRFVGTPKVIGGSVWLRVKTEGVPPPLFSGLGSNDDDASLAAGTGNSPAGNGGPTGRRKSVERLFRRSVTESLPANSGIPGPNGNGEEATSLAPSPDSELWVGDDKVYITRIRDFDLERGVVSYSTLTRNQANSVGTVSAARPTLRRNRSATSAAALTVATTAGPFSPFLGEVFSGRAIVA